MRVKMLLIATILVISQLFAGAALASVGPLGGTTWRVVAYNPDKNMYNTLKMVPEGTEFTANFGRDGRITGDLEGRNYSAMYNVNGTNIHIKNVTGAQNVSYRNNPNYSHENRSFLNALDGVTWWRMAGGQLDLLYHDGRIAATLLSSNTGSYASRPNVQQSAPASSTYVVVASAGSDLKNTYLYRNENNQEARVTIDSPDEVTMAIDGNSYRMNHVVSASGARYEAANDASTVFWSQGEKAFISVRGHDYPEFTVVNAPIMGTEVIPMSTPVPEKAALYRSGTREALLEKNGPEAARLTVDGESYQMKKVVAAAGVKYEALADGGSTNPADRTVFWERDGKVMISIMGYEDWDFEYVDGVEITPTSTTTYEETSRVYTTPIDFTRGPVTLRSGARRALIEPNGPNAIRMTIDGETYQMRKVTAAPGVKYESIADSGSTNPTDRTVLWERDGRIMISIMGFEDWDFAPVAQ